MIKPNNNKHPQGPHCNADVYLESIDDELEEDYYELSPEPVKSSLYVGVVIFLVVILTGVVGLVKVVLGKRHLFKQRNRETPDDEDDQQEEERLITNDFYNLKRFNKGEDPHDLKLDVDGILDGQIGELITSYALTTF